MLQTRANRFEFHVPKEVPGKKTKDGFVDFPGNGRGIYLRPVAFVTLP